VLCRVCQRCWQQLPARRPTFAEMQAELHGASANAEMVSGWPTWGWVGQLMAGRVGSAWAICATEERAPIHGLAPGWQRRLGPRNRALSPPPVGEGIRCPFAVESVWLAIVRAVCD
jgi:hypothetical protein